MENDEDHHRRDNGSPAELIRHGIGHNQSIRDSIRDAALNEPLMDNSRVDFPDLKPVR